MILNNYLKKDKMKFFKVVFCFLLFANNVFAQSDSSSVFREIFTKDNILDVESAHRSVVIGAARSTRTADKLPVTVYIINSDEIIRNNCYTLTDVLKNVPGFRISNPHSGEFGEAFLQRGMMGNTYSKILLNGIEIKPSGLTGMTLGANIPIRNAERIEIVYGPASASYGNDACAGVINIVTRNSSEKNFTQVDLGVGAGNDGYNYFNFASGGKFGHGKHVVEFTFYGNRLNVKNLDIHSDKGLYNRWNYLASTKSESNNAIDASTLTAALQSGAMDMQTLIAQKPELYAYTLNYNGDVIDAKIGDIPQFGSQMGIEVKYGGLKFMYNNLYRRDHSSLGISPMLWNYENPQAFFGEYINRWTLSADYSMGKVNTNTVLGYLRYRMDRNSNCWVNWSKTDQYVYGASDDLFVEENINAKMGECFQFLAGASFKYSGVLPMTIINENRFDYSAYKMFCESVDFEYPHWGKFGINPKVFNTSGVYAQLDWEKKTTEKQSILLTAGCRYDYNSIWGSSINPRIAALWQINENLNFRVSRGYAYKAPSLNQMYYSICVSMKYGENDLYSYHHIPNENLKPEQIASTEFGLRQYIPNTKNYMELIVYTNKITDPLVRSWVMLDQSKYPGVGSSESRTMTRAYKNVDGAFTRLRGYQFIGVFKDIIKAIHLNTDGGITLSMGKERVQDEFSRDENHNPYPDKYVEVKSIRQIPRWQAQIAFDFSILKDYVWFRLENIYCSEFERKYYLAGEGSTDKEPSFYNLDFSLGAKIGKHLVFSFRVINLTDAEYGGIDMKEMDVDLPYNIQLRRSMRVGLSYNF